MKRIKTIGVLILSLLILMLLPAQAATIDLVSDEVGLLSQDQYFELNQRAEDIAGQYDCEVSIVIVEEIGDDGARDFAKYIYDEYDFGYGQDKSGVMLLLSVEERDHALIAYGYGNTVLTDHGRDVLLNQHLLPLLAEDQYYEGFLVYLEQTAKFIEMADQGTPFDVDTDENAGGFPWINLAIVIFAPLLAAGGVCLIFYNQMQTAVAQRSADNYIPEGGFNLTMQADHFLYATETRTKIEEEGGTSTDSDGFSGSSGKY